MIGKKVKLRRTELGMTQDELAKRLGYESRSAICLIESDKRDVNQKTLIKLAEALQVEPTYFFDFDYTRNKDLYELSKGLTSEQLEAVISIVRSML